MHTKFVINVFIIINTLLLSSVPNEKINHTMVLLFFYFCEGVVTIVTNLLERKIIFIFVKSYMMYEIQKPLLVHLYLVQYCMHM